MKTKGCLSVLGSGRRGLARRPEDQTGPAGFVPTTQIRDTVYLGPGLLSAFISSVSIKCNKILNSILEAGEVISRLE